MCPKQLPRQHFMSVVRAVTHFEGFGEQSRTLRMAGAWKPWTHWRG